MSPIDELQEIIDEHEDWYLEDCLDLVIERIIKRLEDYAREKYPRALPKPRKESAL